MDRISMKFSRPCRNLQRVWWLQRRKNELITAVIPFCSTTSGCIRHPWKRANIKAIFCPPCQITQLMRSVKDDRGVCVCVHRGLSNMVHMWNVLYTAERAHHFPMLQITLEVHSTGSWGTIGFGIPQLGIGPPNIIFRYQATVKTLLLGRKID